MTKEEKIISELYNAKKVELGTHKVDLSALDNFQKAQSAAQDSYGMGYNKIKDALKPLQEALMQLKMADSAVLRAIAVGDKFEKDTISLGVDLPPVYKSIKDRLISDKDRIKFAVDRIKKLQSELNF